MYYELSFIVSPVVPENDQARIQTTVAEYLNNIGAKIVGDYHLLGRRKLSYPIKTQKHGFYVFLDFSLETEDKANLKQLDLSLKHNPEILRHLVLKKDKPTPANLIAKLMNATKPEALTRRPKKTTTTARTTSPRSAAPITKKVEGSKNEATLSLDDIDKELDEILTKEPNLD